MTPDFQDICRTVHAALVSLHASGADGFEGFIRDAYREATGVALRLQKPGPQGGADAVSDGADEIAAGIEAKRYREATSLPLDELKSKLIDAATRLGNPIELWILAASKEISGDDVAQLRRIGEHNGIGVLVLDWRSDADPVAPLPLLLALAPVAAGRRLGDEAARALDAITRYPEFDVRKRALLDELTRPDLGRSHAATAVADRMAQTLRSRADAKARLQNPVDMEAPSRIWAPRDGHCQVIQEWSRDAASTPICAIIGEEGAGKTWLMFDWWRREIGREARPLILWLSAREVTSSSLSEVMGAALAKWIVTPKRDAAFWSRRVELWRRTRDASRATPSMWLMLDGVNEGSSQQHVATVLAEALATEWKGVVGILLSDRPAHWERRFQSGKGLELRPKTVSVTRFTDAELDGMLARHGKSRDVLSANVLELIKWPSWFAVAAEMFARERDWSAHSAEQLMMRYVQHRLEERTQVSAISNDMFREFMTGLGSEMRANWGPGKKFSRAELKERLSGYSGEPDKGILDAVDDITSGIWMTPDGLNQFSIDKSVLPFAISLALLNQLRSASTEEEAESEIERFLGPIEDQDVGVNVLAAAASLAFIDERLADHTRKALLKRWRAARAGLDSEMNSMLSPTNRPKVFLCSVFDPGIHEPLRAASPGLIWDPRDYVVEAPGRTIEDICRELIRYSQLFVGVFDERGGHAPFEQGIAPVTVLEIELLQALFQRMPVYLFLLPGFERNRRLAGLVDMARSYGLAIVRTCPADAVRRCDAPHTELTPRGIAMISRVIRDPLPQRLSRNVTALARRMRPFAHLDASMLDMPTAAVCDPFDGAEVARQLEKASAQTDHAARHAYLWPALRQLASVPYDDPQFEPYRPMWERMARAWDHSAAWYGLHDDSPISKLAAVNTLLWILGSGTRAGIEPDFARGARASAFYSMAKRLCEPLSRRRLFLRALAETEQAIGSSPKDVSGYLAIRGSVHLKLWHVARAVADYEAVVAGRAAQNASASSQGEAWVELGWGYFWALKLRKARHALRHGLALMREDYRRDPALRTDFLIRALLKHALAFALMLDFAEAKKSAREGCRLARERVAHDQLGGLRGRLCRWWTN